MDTQAEYIEWANRGRMEDGLPPIAQDEEAALYAKYVWEQPRLSATKAALNELADLADTLAGDERTTLVQVMQQISDLYDTVGDVEIWLKECQQPA